VGFVKVPGRCSTLWFFPPQLGKRKFKGIRAWFVAEFRPFHDPLPGPPHPYSGPAPCNGPPNHWRGKNKTKSNVLERPTEPSKRWPAVCESQPNSHWRWCESLLFWGPVFPSPRGISPTVVQVKATQPRPPLVCFKSYVHPARPPRKASFLFGITP